MSTPKAISLNTGLDLSANPLQKEEGALVGCLNYEMTEISGYKRIDGYERYDGYPNGAIYEYYNITINAVNPADQVKIVAGTIISRVAGAIKTNIGVIVDGPFPVNKYNVVPTLDPILFSFEEYFLLLQQGGFLLLQDGEGVLRLAEDSNPLGDVFVVTGLDGIDFQVTVTGSPAPGRSLAASPQEYIDNIREYSAVLRNLVINAPGPIAGLYWFEDRLLVAVNTVEASVIIPNASPQPVQGARYLWQGVVYRLANAAVTSTPPGATGYTLSLFPIGTNATNNSNLTNIDAVGTVGTVLITDFTSFNPTNQRSQVAALGYFNNPRTSPTRGFTFLNPGMQFAFTNGSNPVESVPPITFGAGASPSDSYYIVGSGSTVLKVRLLNIRADAGGTWVAGTKTGVLQVAFVERISGTRDYVIAGDVLHATYPTTGTSARATMSGTALMPVIAGTAALDQENTKYVWTVANFYGNVSTLYAYGATGASRAFFANKYAYGTIVGNASLALDKPKYIAYFTNHLALGYAAGSVQLSVVGEPTDFTSAGAVEIATGDDITGLLELPGDTLAVFGKRTIRRITGSSPETYAQSSLAGAGCFNYTAVLIGQNAIFTNSNGITTLEQTAAYGDFIGTRISSKITNWLRPKLVGGIQQFGTAGAVLAYPVRAKNQYRLVLTTGEVVCVTITPQGPAITFTNHGSSSGTKIPYCISSEISDTGLERIHTSWAAPVETRNRAFELDVGWGFDGVTFVHYVDIAHVFATGGTTFTVAKRLRVYGESFGSATLNLKVAGIETDFNQAYHRTIQDISLPRNMTLLTTSPEDVTNSVDTAARGLGLKIGIYGTTDEGSAATEPSHNLQVLMLYLDSEGGLQDG